MDNITPATRRMTYAELGGARGISPKSAERLAQRRRWPRQVGNDGMARVVVPIGEDRVIPRRQGPPSAPDVAARRGVTSTPDIGEVVRASIRDIVAPLSAQLEHERARADRAEEKADRLQAELVKLRVSERSTADLAKYATGEATDLRQRLDAAEQRAGEERARADRTGQQLTAVEAELVEARVEAAGLRCKLEQARKAVPDSPHSPWRRFLAWRR